MAAVLAAGPGAVLSHRSAAALWRFRGTEGPSRIEVTAPRSRRSRPGIRVFHGAMKPDEITTEDGIPVTTVPRTILDLASQLDAHGVERAMNQAQALHPTDPLPLGAVVDRYPRRKGTGTIRTILAARGEAQGATKSDLEEAFLAFLAARNLPQPEGQHPHRGRRNPVRVRLHLAPPTPGRRARQPHMARRRRSIRTRPPTRPVVAGRRLANDPHHLAPVAKMHLTTSSATSEHCSVRSFVADGLRGP